MASLTLWTWVWVNSGSWWWTGRPGLLQFMGSQRVGHDWVTELTELTEWSSGFSNFFQFKCEFGNKEFMIWAIVNSRSCFYRLYRESFSIFGCKEYNQSDFGVDHLVMSMYRVFSCIFGRGWLLWPVHFLGKTLLVFALLHSVFQGQICLLTL